MLLKSVFAAALLAMSVDAFAQVEFLPVLPNGVEVTKTKITCYANGHEIYTFEDGEVQNVMTKGKVSESLRTTWKESDRVEYRMSDWTSFDANSGDETAKGHTMMTVETLIAGNLAKVRTVTRSFSQRLGGYSNSTSHRLSERNEEVFSTYKLENNTRTLLESLVNGVPQAAGDVETTEVLNSKTSLITITMAPRKEHIGGVTIETVRYQLACTQEIQ